jgi:type II secretory pathway component GspD/PulD (secretin)
MLLCCVSPCWAEVPPPPAPTIDAPADTEGYPSVNYYIINQDVRSAMSDISKILNVPITLANDVKGKATAGKYSGTPVQILDKLCADLGLQRFYDGNTLYISKASSAMTKVLDLKNISMADLTAGLTQVGIDLQQFPVRFDAERNLAILYGPPRYIAVAEAVAAQIIQNRARSRPSVLRGG